MKKIGTLTSAAGLIFIGVWMIIGNINSSLGDTIFKFWPVLFILLGGEILFTLNSRSEGEPVRINYIIIPVIVVLLSLNMYIGIKGRIGNVIESIDSGISLEDGININFGTRGKRLESSKILKRDGDELFLKLTNGDIEVKKSDSSDILIDAEVYVDNDSSINKYDIDEDTTKDGYKVDFDQSYVRGVKTTVFIPDGMKVKIDGSNIQVKSLEDDLKVDFDVDGSNGNILLESDIENADINMSNGNVNIDNKTIKNISIDMSNGKIEIDTEEHDIDIKVDLNSGICNLNGDKKINSGVEKTIGAGTGKLNIDIGNGVVNIDTQE